MMKCNFSQALRLPNLLDASFGSILESGFLNKTKLSMLFKLIRNRRSLPVYRGDFWICYECLFTSEKLGTMTMHIMRAHKSAPLSDEEIADAQEFGC